MKILKSTRATLTPTALTRRVQRWSALSIVGMTSLWSAASLPACGSDGTSLVCGKGTKRTGDECIGILQAVDQDGGTGGKSGTGGTTSTGGITSTGGGKAAPPDGGAEDVEKLTFTGLTSASPANQTPPGKGKSSPDSVRLSWDEATYDARPTATIHYEIFWSDAAGEENFAAAQETAPPGSTGFTVQGLDAKTKYYFVVRAVADKGTAKDANKVELDATPDFDDDAPTFAGAKSATSAGPTSIKVTWPAAKDDGTDAAGIVYRVYWTDDAGKNLRLGTISAPGATSAVVTGLGAPETDYFFRVLAVDAAGNVDDNNIDVRGTTGKDETAPVFAGCLAATEPSASTAILTWAPAVDDTTTADKIAYTVYASDVPIDKNTDFKSLIVAGTFTGVTRGQAAGLSPGTRYRFVCRASDASKNEDKNLVIQTAITGSDGQPPTFTGLQTAVPDSANIMLTWDQAHDDQTADKDVVYRVYAALASGQQDLTNPIVTSPPGVTGITVQRGQLLSLTDKVSNKDFFFVVRAADAAGNVDDNQDEKTVHTIVSFSDDVQPIFTANCAILGCHTTQDPTQPPIQGQVLDEGASYLSIVGVDSREKPGVTRVNVSKVLNDSYLYRKITGTGDITGSTMPPLASGKTLGPEDKQTLIDWIAAGAPNN